MGRIYCKSLLAILTLAAGVVYADSFEFLTYKPPSGWTSQAAADATTYRRQSGIGAVAFYPSYPTTGTAGDEFAKIWRARMEKQLQGSVPQFQVTRMGDFSLAIGGLKVDAQEGMTTVSLITFVGRGRALGVMGIASGDEAAREMVAFLDTLTPLPVGAVGVTPDSGSAAAGGVEVDFDVPAGYVSERNGASIVLKPRTLDVKTPCVYGISPSRPTRGGLDMDASVAILEALPGWQLKNDHEYNAWKGISGAGWPYFWFRRDVGQLQGGSYQYLAAMTMAFPAGPGRVNILWGYGPPQACTLNDISFVRLFQSLRPRGWTPDGGKALAQELQGTWRDTQNGGMSQYTFLPNGQYEYGLGTSATTGNLERRTGSVSDGHYELRGSELILTGRRGGKYRIRIYDDLRLGKWTRTLSLLNESGTPVSDLHYLKVGN